MGKKFANELVKMRTATFTPLLDILHCFDAVEYHEQFDFISTELESLSKTAEEY